MWQMKIRKTLFLKQIKITGRYYWYHEFDFTIPQEKIVKLKYSIENVVNQKSVTPKHDIICCAKFHQNEKQTSSTF